MDVFINDNPINNKPNPEENRKCIYRFFFIAEQDRTRPPTQTAGWKLLLYPY
jgi:hypothetical protein